MEILSTLIGPSYQFIFHGSYFWWYILTTTKKAHITRPRIPRFSPMVFSKSFIVLCFTFRSMIHFALIFVRGTMVSVFRFTSLHVGVQLLKRLSFLCWIAFAPLSKDHWLYLCGSACGLSVLFHWSLFFHQYHTVLMTVVILPYTGDMS